MAVYDIILQDPTERVSPPEQTVRVTAVDDLAFLEIERYDEANGARTFTKVAGIAVSLPALREAVQLLTNERDREDNRPTDDRGNVSARIAGHRYTVVPL